jgi:hypothetical protein
VSIPQSDRLRARRLQGACSCSAAIDHLLGLVMEAAVAVSVCAFVARTQAPTRACTRVCWGLKQKRGPLLTVGFS